MVSVEDPVNLSAPFTVLNYMELQYSRRSVFSEHDAQPRENQGSNWGVETVSLHYSFYKPRLPYFHSRGLPL